MKPLSPTDQLFLWLEKRQQPMHVGGLQLFSFPDDAPDDYVAQLADRLRQYTKVTPPFNQRLDYRFGQPVWVEDEHLDLEHHFRFEALPTPGRVRELLSFVSAEHSHLMDRERPLWEFHLIEGLGERQFAVYIKVHHALVDGVSAMRMVTQMLCQDTGERDMPPIWAMPPKQRAPKALIKPQDLVSGFGDFFGGAGKQISTLPKVASEVAKLFRSARKDSSHVSICQAPNFVLNEPITGSRRFAAQSYSMERIKHVAKAFRGTMNDVVLAICGSALRDYLISLHALPDEPLVAMVPVSIRSDDSDSGNQIAMILVNLGTHIADPALRMETIQASVKESKDRYKSMTPEETLNYTALTMAPAGFNMLTGLISNWQPFNVIISNVPGPKKTMYWNGAKLEGMYPVSIPMDRIALNITLLSYENQLEFGLTACRRTLPSMQRLLDFIDNGIHELEVAADIHHK